MIGVIDNYTQEYIDSIPKKDRKKIGQFFTQVNTANFMGNLIRNERESIRVLDCGAGSGILTASVCKKYLASNIVRNIHVDLYENNSDIIPVLQHSMSYLQMRMEENNIEFTYTIIEENFILYNADYWNGRTDKDDNELYDLIISNPPYKKISKSDEESLKMINIVYGQPNIYFLFIAMATKLLKENGEMIFITPRSFTSGAYFKKFREYLFSQVEITNLHLFKSRSKVFNKDNILQETLIFRASKTRNQINNVSITTSSDFRFEDINEILIRNNVIMDIESENKYLLLPTSNEEIEVINMFNSFRYTISDLGFKFSTGKVVDFRATEFIKFENNQSCVPLIWSCNFSNNRVVHPVDNIKNQQYILYNLQSNKLMVENKDYILIKRFTSKEEYKRIQAALFFAEDFNQYNYIGIENHLNYIYKVNGDFEREELYGLFVIFNSTYFDMYYRILNGSTQVNASEINSIKLPDINSIRRIGIQFMNSERTVDTCDSLVRNYFNNTID